MTATLPAPASNMTAAGLFDRATDLVSSTTTKYAAGDYTGGASEQLWTLAAHGLNSGDAVHCVWQSAMGAVIGGEGSRWYVKKLSSSTFQLYSDSTLATISTNTADGNAVFISGEIDDAMIALGVIPNIIVGAHDFTGGSAEDIDVPAQGTRGIYEGDTLKLLYKSAAGAAAIAVDASIYAKAPTVLLFQTAATSGGAVLDTTADGTNVWLKTS